MQNVLRDTVPNCINRLHFLNHLSDMDLLVPKDYMRLWDCWRSYGMVWSVPSSRSDARLFSVSLSAVVWHTREVDRLPHLFRPQAYVRQAAPLCLGLPHRMVQSSACELLRGSHLGARMGACSAPWRLVLRVCDCI